MSVGDAAVVSALKKQTEAIKDLTRVMAVINENMVEIGRMMQKEQNAKEAAVEKAPVWGPKKEEPPQLH